MKYFYHGMNGLGFQFHLQIPNQVWVAMIENDLVIVISNVENTVDGVNLGTALL